MFCVHQGYGNNGQLWLTKLDGARWVDLQVPSLGISASPALTVRTLAPGQQELHCAHQASGNNGQLAINVFDGYSYWSGDCQVRSVGLTDSPALAWFNGLLYCAHQGPGGDGQLWYTTFDGKTWAPDTQIRLREGISASPALCVYKGLLYCAFQRGGNTGFLKYTTFDGKTWAEDQYVPRVGMSASPALCVFNDQLYCAHQGWGNDSGLWYTSFDNTIWAADQPAGGVMITDSPSLTVTASDAPGGQYVANQLFCAHQGWEGYENNGQLWYTTFDGKNWSEDQGIPNVGISGSPSVYDI